MNLRKRWSTTRNSRRFGVIPALLIVMMWTANSAAFAGPRYVQSLFDLTVEELMEIRIGAELRLGYWTSPGEGVSSAERRHDLRMELNVASRPGAEWLHASRGDPTAEINDL